MIPDQLLILALGFCLGLVTASFALSDHAFYRKKPNAVVPKNMVGWVTMRSDGTVFERMYFDPGTGFTVKETFGP